MTTRKFLLCFILATLTVGIQADLFEHVVLQGTRNFADDCQEELEIPMCTYEELLDSHPMAADDEDGKNLMFCVLTKVGLMDKDGSFTLDILFPINTIMYPFADEVESKAIEDFIRSCATQMDTPRDSAREFLTCLQLHNECIHEAGLKSGKLEKYGENVDPKWKQFLFCQLTNLYIMNTRGHIVMHELQNEMQRSNYTKEQETQILRKCTRYKGTGEETAYHLVTCMEAVRGIKQN